jgi:hypothetical protein
MKPVSLRIEDNILQRPRPPASLAGGKVTCSLGPCATGVIAKAAHKSLSAVSAAATSPKGTVMRNWLIVGLQDSGPRAADDGLRAKPF